MSCCFVSLTDGANDISDIPCVDSMCGLVTELKLSYESNYSICECFRNMSAVGPSLAIDELLGGTLVNQAIVNGVVANVNGLEHTVASY